MRFLITFLISAIVGLFIKKTYDPEMEKLYDNIVKYDLKTIR